MPKIPKRKYVLSYGGGVNSSALFFYLIENEYPLDYVIFADTGEELPETYDAVKRLKKECEIRNIEFVTVKSELGNLYDFHYENNIVPSISRRDCTYKFKILPIRKWLRDKERFNKGQKFDMYIGITFDEIHRVNPSKVQYISNCYPFVENKITREDNYDILNKYMFRATKSGCIGCPFNNKAKWIKLYKENPEEFARWERLDKNGRRYPEITLTPIAPLEKIREYIETGSWDNVEDAPEPSCDRFGGCFL